MEGISKRIVASGVRREEEARSATEVVVLFTELHSPNTRSQRGRGVLDNDKIRLDNLICC